MRLNIGIDIDGTITDPYQWLGLLNGYFGTNITKKDMVSYHVEDFSSITTEEFGDFMKECGDKMCSTAIPRDASSELVNKLHKNHNIHFITARESSSRESTEDWFRRYNFPLANLHMLGNHNKLAIAKELKCDLFIEDRYETAIELALAGIKVLLLDCNYNRQPLIPGIIRVYNWLEIEEEINNMIKRGEKEALVMSKKRNKVVNFEIS